MVFEGIALTVLRTRHLENVGLVLLPIVALGLAAFGALVAGRPRSVLTVRVLGGPTEGARRFSARVEVFERDREGTAPVAARPVQVDLSRGSEVVAAPPALLDVDGAVVVNVPLVSSLAPLKIRVHLAGTLIAEERISLTTAEWGRAAQRHGGWGEAAAGAGLSLRVAAGRGAFAVPFEDPLFVEARGSAGPAIGVVITALAEGARVRPSSVTTDARGKARFAVTPTEHAPSFLLRATAATGEGAVLEFGLPVTPGALHAERVDGQVVIRSPIARSRAYVALVTEKERIGGGGVALEADPRGGAVGTLPLPVDVDAPLWAVVSGEPDLRSAAVVGWPLVSASAPEPASTFDAVDAVLVDTSAKAMARERDRARTARRTYAAWVALALGVESLLALLRARTAARTPQGPAVDGLPSRRPTAELLTLLSVLVLATVMLVAFTLLAGAG